MVRRSARFLALPLAGALGYAGAVVGYAPLLALLLPIQVARAAGPGRYAALAVVLAVGAVVAGAANLAFGWLSDRSRRRGGGRRQWIAAGLVALVASFAAIATARGMVAIIVAVAAFQVAINAILAPLLTLIAEEVPPGRTGFATGLFSAGPLVGAVVTLALAAPALASEGARLAVIAATSALCLLPLLVTRPRPLGDEQAPAPPAPARRGALAIAWTARLFVQVAGTVLFADLLYLLDAAGDGGAAARVGSLLLLANVLPLPIAVLLGDWSDRTARLRVCLVGAAIAAAVGLVQMAAAAGSTGRAIGFLLFATGWGVFLPLQVGDVMRRLPDINHRGRDLGVLNLANTLPVLIGQGLAWWLATPRDAAPLLLALAALTLTGGALTLAVPGRR